MEYPSTGTGPRPVIGYAYLFGQPRLAADLSAGTTLWRRGQESYGLRDSEVFGNGVVSTRELDPRTGEVRRIESFANAENLSLDALAAGSYADRRLSRWGLSYDANGNLLTRNDSTGTGSPGAITAYRYDGLGNLTFKGAGDESVGVYSYDRKLRAWRLGRRDRRGRHG